MSYIWNNRSWEETQRSRLDGGPRTSLLTLMEPRLDAELPPTAAPRPMISYAIPTKIKPPTKAQLARQAARARFRQRLTIQLALLALVLTWALYRTLVP